MANQKRVVADGHRSWTAGGRWRGLALAGILLVMLTSRGALGAEGKIVFVSNRGGNYDIWMAQADGSNPVQLTTDAGEDRLPQFSPDGTEILFSSDRGGQQQPWLMSVKGTNQRRVSDVAVVDGLAWSPGGDRICVLYESGGSSTIVVMKKDGTNSRQVYSATGRGGSIDWIPGTETLVFGRETRNNWSPTTELWKINSDGSNLVRLTNNAVSDRRPKVSPDGKRIVFARSHGARGYGNYRIYTMDIDGTNVSQLVAEAVNAEHPCWSPDGKKVAYERQGADWDIYTVNADGSGQAKAIAGAGNDLHPDWGTSGPPLPSIDSIAPNPALVGETVAFDGTATDDGEVVQYSWDFDGDGVVDYSGTTAPAAHVYMAPGTYTVSFTAMDDDGLTASTSASIKVDASSKLKVWISVPKDGRTVQGDAVKVRANTAPGRKTASVQLQYKAATETDWNDLGNLLTPPPYSFAATWDVTGLSEGDYCLRAVATDTSGGRAISATITVIVATSGPDADRDHPDNCRRRRRPRHNRRLPERGGSHGRRCSREANLDCTSEDVF